MINYRTFNREATSKFNSLPINHILKLVFYAVLRLNICYNIGYALGFLEDFTGSSLIFRRLVSSTCKIVPFPNMSR